LGSIREPTEPLGLSEMGRSILVSSMPLKGMGEARGKPLRRPAWLRDRMVSSNEAESTFGEWGPWLKTLPDGPVSVCKVCVAVALWLHHPDWFNRRR
jgi:hypothetical protein